MRRNNHHGFTLIELLVVISIVTLLIAVLLPALGKAREAGRLALCLSNLRQIGVGTQAYLNDFGFNYPPTYIPAIPDWSQLSWLGKAGAVGSGYEAFSADRRPLNAYLGGPFQAADEVPVTRCPSDHCDLGPSGSLYTEVGSPYLANADSGVFGGTFRSLSLNGSLKSVNASMIKSPARMVCIAEFGFFNPVWSGYFRNATFFFHSVDPKWTVSYADGHARLVLVGLYVASNADYTINRDE